MTTLTQITNAPVSISITVEKDVCRYAVQQIEQHIRTYHARIQERIDMYDYEEARSIRKYLRTYWKELVPPNEGEINYWGYALRSMIHNFYYKNYGHLSWDMLRSLMIKIKEQIDAEWEYRQELEDDEWLEELYEEFHPDKVLSKIRIPTKDPRVAKVESATGQQGGTA